MQFKKSNNNAELSENQLVVSTDSIVFFEYNNEQCVKTIKLEDNSSLKFFSIYKNSKVKNS
ncbi:hypothetical protein KJ780_02015, partial [Candidatus Micrarchaeota archaeon]|nr:hypothetical protein [Candidatus Micrarchaeota archaeon]